MLTYPRVRLDVGLREHDGERVDPQVADLCWQLAEVRLEQDAAVTPGS